MIRIIRKNIIKIKGKLGIPVSKRALYNFFLDEFRINKNVKEVSKSGDNLLAVRIENFSDPIFARSFPHSDIYVLKQVFLDKEYKPVVDYLLDNLKDPGRLKIIDAGANVGYFSYYLKNFLLNANFACVEPDANNLQMLKRNLQSFIDKSEVVIYKNGLGPVSDQFLKIATDFRDGMDWSLTVNESSTPTELKSISVQKIIDDNKWDVVDILKIDIEGGERFLFTKEADLNYLSKVKLIVLEIHDEFNIRKAINEILSSHQFSILNFGETTLALNNKFIS